MAAKPIQEERAQYRTPVVENFPDRLGVVNLDELASRLSESLDILGLRGKKRREVETAVRDSVVGSSTIFNKNLSLRYGQNPGAPAAFYKEIGASGPSTATMEVIQEGKGLGFINIGDLDLGLQFAKSCYDISEGKLVAAIVKHEMLSGVARGTNPFETYNRAFYADDLSNFGGVVVLSYEPTPNIARVIVEQGKLRNTEVLVAPGYSDEVKEILKGRKDLRVVQIENMSNPIINNGITYKRTDGGLLVENRFSPKTKTIDDLDCISATKPTISDLYTALFLWQATAYTRSNAVLIGVEDTVYGIGSGQRSRIDAAEDAIKLSKRGYGYEGTFMASDAFMPATDVVELAKESGVRGIVYPKGSLMDDAVLEKANQYNLVMLITRKPGSTEGGERCFLHR